MIFYCKICKRVAEYYHIISLADRHILFAKLSIYFHLINPTNEKKTNRDRRKVSPLLIVAVKLTDRIIMCPHTYNLYSTLVINAIQLYGGVVCLINQTVLNINSS